MRKCCYDSNNKKSECASTSQAKPTACRRIAPQLGCPACFSFGFCSSSTLLCVSICLSCLCSPNHWFVFAIRLCLYKTVYLFVFMVLFVFHMRSTFTTFPPGRPTSSDILRHAKRKHTHTHIVSANHRPNSQRRRQHPRHKLPHERNTSSIIYVCCNTLSYACPPVLYVSCHLFAEKAAQRTVYACACSMCIVSLTLSVCVCSGNGDGTTTRTNKARQTKTPMKYASVELIK